MCVCVSPSLYVYVCVSPPQLTLMNAITDAVYLSLSLSQPTLMNAITAAVTPPPSCPQ